MLKIAIITSEPNGWIATSMQTEAKILGLKCDIINHDTVKLITNSKGKFDIDIEKDYDVVIPRISEYDIDIKMTILNIMIDRGMQVINSPAGIAVASNKLYSQMLLANHCDGVKAIPTQVLHNIDQIDEISDKISYPIVLKTITGTHGIGVMKCDSAASFKSVAQVIIEKFKTPILIQQFIDHDESYRTIVLGDSILAANCRKSPNKNSDFRTNSHQGSETERYDPPTEIAEKSIMIAKKFGLEFCAIDFILVDGEMVIFEVNGSPGLENIQDNYQDRNLCSDVIKYAAKKCGIEVNDVDPVNLSCDIEDDISKIDTVMDKQVISTEESIIIRRMNNNKPIIAKVDTGADSCSIHAENILVNDEAGTLQFVFNNVKYTIPFDREIKVKSANSHDRRFKICLNVVINNVEYNDVEFTLADRSDMEYEVLIGKNLIDMMNAVVTVS